MTNSLVPAAGSNSPIYKKITSCDNIVKQCGKSNCMGNFGLTRNNTIDRVQCARNNKLINFQLFKSTPDLTSSNISNETLSLTKTNVTTTDEPSHPDVILLNNYQPLRNPQFQCHHHHQHNQNPISTATGHNCGSNQMPFFMLQRKMLPSSSPATSSFLTETYCSCCRKRNNCDDDTCQSRIANENQNVLQRATSSKSLTNAISTTTPTITSTRF